MNLTINLVIREKDIDNNPIPVEAIKKDILNDINKQWNVSEYDFKVTGNTDAEKLEALENKVLYNYFKQRNPDTLIKAIAPYFLKGEEFKEYNKLQEIV